jgi:hypothetical protein
MITRRSWLAAGACLAVALVAGCSDSGPKRYDVSGSVTLEGRPIPFGEVVFTPDGAKKNSGPQGIAKIQDGKYDTRLPGGLGVAGGPTVIRVNGLSGPGGRTLCEYDLRVDLPRADTTQDIEVPKTNPVAKTAKEI